MIDSAYSPAAGSWTWNAARRSDSSHLNDTKPLPNSGPSSLVAFALLRGPMLSANELRRATYVKVPASSAGSASVIVTVLLASASTTPET